MKKRGRPRVYDPAEAASDQGAPIVGVRMSPDLRRAVLARGGSTWLRDLAAVTIQHPAMLWKFPLEGEVHSVKGCSTCGVDHDIFMGKLATPETFKGREHTHAGICPAHGTLVYFYPDQIIDGS